MTGEASQNPDAAILDVRPAAEFERVHRIGAVNIPLEELLGRMHELPPRHAPLLVYDTCRTRSRWAASRLRARDRRAIECAWGASWLGEGPVESGPSRDRLWQPHELLVEAIDIARSMWPSFQGRTALDVACGTGRDAVTLALAGFDTTGIDVLPDALDRCRELAMRNGVEVRTVCQDMESNPTLPAGSFDLVGVFNYLHRPLMPVLASAVRPGGLIVYETFVDPQIECFGKPRRRAHVLTPGELAGWFAGWKIRVCREGSVGPRRIAASLIAEKP